MGDVGRAGLADQGLALHHNGGDDLAHPVRLGHHVVPGEPQDHPAVSDQLVIAPTVPLEGDPVTMVLKAVCLHHDAQRLVGQVDDADKPTTSFDPDLWCEGQAPDIAGDRSQNRLERVCCPGISGSSHAAYPGMPAPRARGGRGAQFGWGHQATAEG